MKVAYIPPIDHPDARGEWVQVKDDEKVEITRTVAVPTAREMQLGQTGKVVAQAWRVVPIKSPAED